MLRERRCGNCPCRGTALELFWALLAYSAAMAGVAAGAALVAWWWCRRAPRG